MEQNTGSIEYQVAYAALESESMDRLEQVNNLEIEFLRLFECHVASPETHPLLVYHLRTMIFSIEDIYEGTHEYFKEMKMDFVYGLFRKVQVLMVNGYNFLAQALLGHIKRAELEKEVKEDLKNRETVLTKLSQVERKEPDKVKALEHFDYTINFLQMEQEKLKEEMNRINEHFWMSKSLVDKIAPSKAVKELTQIKERAELTLENSEKIFEETYQLKYLEFKNYLATLKHPEDFTQQFCEGIRTSVRDKFTEGMKKSVNIVYSSVKQSQLENMVDVEMQTSPEKQKLEKKIHLKHGEKMQNLLVRERKMNEKLQIDITTLKQEIEQWKAQKFKLNQKVNELTHRNAELTSNYDVLVKLYQERREENAKLIGDIAQQGDSILQLKQIEAKYLSQIPQKEMGVQANVLPDQKDQIIDVRLFDENQTLLVLRRHNERLKKKMSEMEDRELRSKRVLKSNNIKTDCRMNHLKLDTEPSANVIHQFHTVSHEHHKKRSSIQNCTSVKLLPSRRESRLPSNLLIHLEGVQEETQRQAQGEGQVEVREEKKKSVGMQGGRDHVKQSIKKSKRLYTQESYQEKQNIQIQKGVENDRFGVTRENRKNTKVTLNTEPIELVKPKMRQVPVVVDAETQTLNPIVDTVEPRTEIKRSSKNQPKEEHMLPFTRATKMNKTLPFRIREDSFNPQTKRTESFTINSSKDHMRGKSRFNNNKQAKEEVDSEDQVGSREGTAHKMTRQHFQNLNIHCEESKSMQKRSILSKNHQFFINAFKNRTEDVDMRTQTCCDEVFSSSWKQSEKREDRKGRKKSQTNLMLAVDKVQLARTAQLKELKSSKKKLTAPMSRGWSPQQQEESDNLF